MNRPNARETLNINEIANADGIQRVKEMTTLWSVARRPRWIAALVFALLLAAGFAALSQWQLSRSISTGTVEPRQTETVVTLSSVAEPQHAVTTDATGQLVSATGHWVPGDYVLMSNRLNGDDTGWWVVGHFVTTGQAGVAIAVGWSPDEAGASRALRELRADAPPAGETTVAGRYYPSEGAQDSDYEHGKLTTLSPAALVNIWKNTDPNGIYGGYLVSGKATNGLTTIFSPKPTTAVEVNILNIFYAVEWVVFAGFALYLWYRLVRDAWEREIDEAVEELARLAEVN
jgi:surfeit locus 1 family protein